MASPPPEHGLEAPRRRRRRSPRSCQECRRRKVKCDRKNPCNHCILSKNKCIFGIESVRRTSSSTLYATPIHGAEAIRSQDVLATGQVQVGQTTRAQSAHNYCNEATLAPIDPESQVLNAIPELNDLAQRVRSLKQQLLPEHASSSDTRGKEPPDTSYHRDISRTQDRRIFLNKSRLFGQSHWSNGASEFKRVAITLSGETGNSTDDEATRRLKMDIEALLRKCKGLAKHMKASRPSKCFLCPETIILPSAKSFADNLAQLYMSHFESAFRILHIPSFWSEYEEYWQNPTKAPYSLQFKVQLVLAIGSSICEEIPNITDVRSRAREWLYAAQTWLSGPMEKDRLSINGIQVHCLLLFARQALSVGGDIIWVSMGNLVRGAMQLGLHRDPKHFAKMTLLQTELRRRLWATILEMNIQAALDTGMPPSISLDDFDTNLPSNVNDNELEDCVRPLESCPETTVTDTSLQRFLSKYLRTRMQILRCMNGINPELSYEAALSLSSEISKACCECGVYVKKANHTESEIFRLNMADLFLRRFVLSLHRPYASRARLNPSFYFSRKTCFDSALALLSPIPNQEFSRLVKLGGGIFKNRIIHVALALTSEFLIETEEQERDLSTREPSTYMKIIVDAVKEARSQLAQRMQFGETNVRLYMKLGIVIRQAEYRGSGASLQQQLAQSAKESLQTAYSTMQTNSRPLVNWSYHEESITSSQHATEQNFAYGLDFNDILQTADFNIDGVFDSGLPFS